MATEVRGTAKLLPSGSRNWVPATAMTLLKQGDQVMALRGATVTVVLFATGSREQLQPGCKVAITRDGCKVLSGPATRRLRKVPAAAAQRLAGMSVGKGMPGGMLIRSKPGQVVVEARSLYQTSTLEARPTFAWHCAEASVYSLVLFSAPGQVLWTTTTTRQAVAYPANQPALERGRDYVWELEARPQGRQPIVISGLFRVLPDAEAAAVRSEEAQLCPDASGARDATPLLLLAALYSQHGLWDDVVRTHEALARLLPRDAEVARQLDALLVQQGRRAVAGCR